MHFSALKEWAKEKCVQLYNSAWTRDELMEARQYMPPNDNRIISKKMVRDRFYVYGGIPRVVFGSDKDMGVSKANQHWQIQNLTMIRDVLQGALLEHVQGPEDIPTQLFAYQSRPPFTIDTLSIVALSSGARKRIFWVHYDLMMSLVSSLQPPQVHGYKFEDFVGWLLSEGAEALRLDSLETQEWNRSTKKWTKDVRQFVIPKKPLQLSDNKETLLKTWGAWQTTGEVGVVRVPEGFEGIDHLLSACEGVNAAAAKTHDAPPPEFYQDLQTVGVDPADFKVFYFVPGAFYKGFRATKDEDKPEETKAEDEPEETKANAKRKGRPKKPRAPRLTSVRLLKVSVPMSTKSLVAGKAP